MKSETLSDIHPGRYIDTLPNGLTIFLQEIRLYPVVFIDMWVRAGSRDENPNEWGMSHFLEHMIFNGNKLFTREEFNQALYEIGGDFNASTCEDTTDYFILVTSEHFRKGLELHSAMVSSPILGAGLFKQERDVVKEEIRLYEDNPSITLIEKTDMQLFEGLGYSHPILGTTEILEKMTPELMREYFDRHYIPENMMLILIGDFDTREVLPLIRQTWSDYKKDAAKIDTVQFNDIQQIEPKLLKLKGDIDTTYLTVVFKAPPLKSMETYAMDVLMEVIGGSRSARLSAKIFEELNLVTEIQGNNQSLRDASKLAIYAELRDSSKLQTVVDEIFKILVTVTEEGISDDEFDRAKTRILAEKVFTNERFWELNDYLGQNIMLGDLDIAESYLDRIASVTPNQVLGVARKYLKPGNMALGVNYPEKDGDIDISLAIFKPNNTNQVKHKPDFGEITTQFSKTRLFGGELGPVKSGELPNGVTWLYRNNPSIPSVSVHVYVRGGLAFETWDTNGIAEVVQRSLRKGTRSKSVNELNLEIDSLGARIEMEAQRDYLSTTGLFLARDFEKGFSLITEMILEPAFPEEEVTKVRDEVHGAILRDNDDTARVSVNRLRMEIFGQDHPYGRSSVGREEAVSELSITDIREFHQNVYSPENIVVCVVGDIDEDNARTAIENTFAELPPSGNIVPEPLPPNEIIGENVLLISREKSQIRITMGKPGLSVFDPDYPAAKVMDAIIGGTPFSRLFQTVRERDGLAYDIFSDLGPTRSQGLFFTFMGTAPENYERAVEGIKGEYRTLIKDGPSDKELESAVNSLRGQSLLWRTGNNALAIRMGRNSVIGLPYDFDMRLLDEFKKVTKADIMRVSEKYCDPDNIVISVCGRV